MLYRFYLLTPADHIDGRREADCADDERAVAAAAALIGRHPAVEVWQERRLVIRLAAKDIRASVSNLPEHRVPNDATRTVLADGHVVVVEGIHP